MNLHPMCVILNAVQVQNTEVKTRFLLVGFQVVTMLCDHFVDVVVFWLFHAFCAVVRFS